MNIKKVHAAFRYQATAVCAKACNTLIHSHVFYVLLILVAASDRKQKQLFEFSKISVGVDSFTDVLVSEENCIQHGFVYDWI